MRDGARAAGRHGRGRRRALCLLPAGRATGRRRHGTGPPGCRYPDGAQVDTRASLAPALALPAVASFVLTPSPTGRLCLRHARLTPPRCARDRAGRELLPLPEIAGLPRCVRRACLRRPRCVLNFAESVHVFVPLDSRERCGARGAAALLGDAAPAVAQDLSLAEAESIAIERDAMLRQMRADAEAMRQRAVMDGQLMDPKLRLGAVNVPVDSFSLRDDDMTMLEVGVSQEFQPGDSRQLSRKRMEQTAAAMDARRGRSQAARAARSAQALDAAGLRQRGARVLDQQVDWVEQMRLSARARYASGEGKQLDVLQAGLDAAMLREQQLDLDRDEAMYRSQLGVLAGRRRGRRAQPDRLAGAGRIASRSPRWKHGLRGTPRRLDFEHRMDAARHAVRSPEKRKPGWMLDVSYGFRQDAPDGMVAARHAERDGHRGPAVVQGQPAGPRGRRGGLKRAACTNGTRTTCAKCRRCLPKHGTWRIARRNSSSSTKTNCCRSPTSRCRRRCSPGARIAS